MKNFTVPILIIIILVLAIALMTVTNRPIYVPSVHPYAKVQTVMLYDGSFDPSAQVTLLDIAPIAEILANAEWTSDSPKTTDRIKMEVEGLPNISIPYWGSFYRLEGVKGQFNINPYDQKKVAAFLQRVRMDFLDKKE